MKWNISRVGSAIVTIIAIGATVWYNFPVGSMAAKQLLGGISPVNSQQNDLELQQLGEFAVNNHNSAANSDLKFVKVVEAKQQVVAGMAYYLTIEATSGGQKGYYDAKVWVKPWENFKQLEQFTSKGPLVSGADLGVKN